MLWVTYYVQHCRGYREALANEEFATETGKENIHLWTLKEENDRLNSSNTRGYQNKGHNEYDLIFSQDRRIPLRHLKERTFENDIGKGQFSKIG